MIEFSTRDGIESDLNFLLATWLKSHKHSGHGMKRVHPAAYYRHHHPLVEAILSRGARVRVATPAGDDETILGYAVSEPGVLHYVYVKLPFRRFGIAMRLIGEMHSEVKQYSYFCDSDAAHALIRKLSHLTYNPYASEEQNGAATKKDGNQGQSGGHSSTAAAAP